MKITREQIKKIVKEKIESVLREQAEERYVTTMDGKLVGTFNYSRLPEKRFLPNPAGKSLGLKPGKTIPNGTKMSTHDDILEGTPPSIPSMRQRDSAGDLKARNLQLRYHVGTSATDDREKALRWAKEGRGIERVRDTKEDRWLTDKDSLSNENTQRIFQITKEELEKILSEEDENLEEEKDEKFLQKIKSTGEWTDYTIGELEKKRDALRKQEKRTPAETKDLRQINFAINAKQGDYQE